MMFVRRPLTHHSWFEPATHSPSIHYLMLQQAGSEDDDEQTTLAANKKQDGNAPTNSATAAAETTSSTTKKDEKSTTSSSSSSSSKKSCAFSLDNFDILEEEHHVLLSTDLPGVKHADVKVEFHDGHLHIEASRKRGNKKQSFMRHLAMDEDVIDVENLTATLEDGILSVRAPKATKQDSSNSNVAEAHKVVVSKAAPPTTEDPNVEWNMEIDMPGVKVNDLEIVLGKNGMLSIFGVRKTTGTKKTEAYMLNPRKVDINKLQAYLCDGVLTIRAPAKVHKVKTVAVNGKLPLTTTTTTTTATAPTPVVEAAEKTAVEEPGPEKKVETVDEKEEDEEKKEQE